MFRAELGMHPLKINRDVRKLKLQYKVRMPRKRLLAIASSAVWEKITKERAGIWWYNVVDNVWKEVGGNQEGVVSMEKF